MVKNRKFRDTIFFRLIVTILILALFGGAGSLYAYVEFKGNPDKSVEKYFSEYMKNNNIKDIIDYKTQMIKKDGVDVYYTVNYYLIDEKNPSNEKGIEKKCNIIISKFREKWYSIVPKYSLKDINEENK